jgi:DNA (cytosine-5)-methyltransferase 1
MNVGNSEERPVNVLAFCAGYGGIERGLDLAGVHHRVIAYVEIEAFAIANLVSKMETGQLDPAPIYTDVKTFPAHLFRGVVDLITGGYPCQPFSAAGKRQGADDPRHLWPFIWHHVRTINPARVFFENVDGHISMGLSTVVSDLEELGYQTTWGVFSAGEVGAPHQRKRVYIMADAQGIGHGDGGGQRDIHQTDGRQVGQGGAVTPSAGQQPENLADSNSQRTGRQPPDDKDTQRQAGSGAEPGGSGGAGEVPYPGHPQRTGRDAPEESDGGVGPARGVPGCESPSLRPHGANPGAGGGHGGEGEGNLADPNSQRSAIVEQDTGPARVQTQRHADHPGAEPGNVPDPHSIGGREGGVPRQRPDGSIIERNGAEGGVGGMADTPVEGSQGQRIVGDPGEEGAQPDDQQLAGCGAPYDGEVPYPGCRCGEGSWICECCWSEQVRWGTFGALGEQTYGAAGWLDGSWELGIERVATGEPDRVDRIRLLGNGVVPQTAAKAWYVLDAGLARARDHCIEVLTEMNVGSD